MATNKELQEMTDELMKLWVLRYKGDYKRTDEKLKQIGAKMVKFPEIRRNFTERDILDRISWIVSHVGSQEGLSAYLKETLEKTLTYQFFFPASELTHFPEGFEIGYGRLFSFPKLPEGIKKYISERWKFDYERDKEDCPTFESYKKQKENELYFCLEIKSFGREKATLLASDKANRSLNILKAVYMVNLSPLKEGEYYVAEREWYGRIGVKKWQWQSHMLSFDGLINSINEIYSKDNPNELEDRIKSAVDTYGIIDMTTPLDLKFLLTVISMEGLLVGKSDYLRWRFREKVALLLGDSLEWLAFFLKKKMYEITEEDVVENLVDSRIELSRRMSDVYDKRSELAHLIVREGRPKEKITERDFRFAEWIFNLLLRKLLDLRSTRGINRIEKDKKGNALDRYLEAIKFASKG